VQTNKAIKRSGVMASSDIYQIGLALIGLTAILAVVAVPTFLFAGKRLEKQLEEDYGKRNRLSKR